tara:strand:- start:43480 stop:44706 length:1227 start_codon:yes stop_codon:yes gene_type:complete
LTIERKTKKHLKINGLMYGLSLGHGVKHFGQGALLLISPHLKNSLGLTEIALGGIFTAQSITSGIANIPSGFLSDIYRKKIAWILFTSMVIVGAGYLMLGLSSWYWMTISAAAMLGFGTSLWHAPAFGTLAARYPDRKGYALAMHLSGAQIGNTLSPIIIGFLLGGTFLGWYFGGWDWKFISISLSIPMVMTGFLVLFFFKTAGAEVKKNPSYNEYIFGFKKIIKNPQILGMIFLGACRGAIHTAFQLFLVLHMKEVLDYSNFIVGFHVALITLAGIISTPIMGILSDRIGRKPIISFSMGMMSILIVMFYFFDSGIIMTILVALLGIFFFSVMPTITAAAMDQVPNGIEGTGTALMFSGLAVIGSLSPIIAGAIYERNLFEGVVIYCASIAVIATFLSIILPMRKKM